MPDVPYVLYVPYVPKIVRALRAHVTLHALRAQMVRALNGTCHEPMKDQTRIKVIKIPDISVSIANCLSVTKDYKER